MKYSTNWLAIIFASIAVHFLAATIFAFVLPKIFPELKVDVAEIEWVDVELVDEVAVIDDEPVAIEDTTVESATESEFAAIELPPLPTFEPIEIPKPKVEETPPPKKVETNSDEVKDAEKKSEPAEEPKGKQLLNSPPITINEVNPTESFNYSGIVAVVATIDKDGKVKRTQVALPSGIKDVDDDAQVAAGKWTFKPALDQDGKPMECDKVITFDYKKIFFE